jgi:dTDP-4-dehydrorhamnose reductase
MKKIAILGPTGMLGGEVYSVLKNKYKLVLVLRDINKISTLYDFYGKNNDNKIVELSTDKIIKDFTIGFYNNHKSENFQKLVNEIGTVDAIINCIGITNRYCNKNPLEAFYINSAFPFWLSWQYGEKLIHITTDCTFSGQDNAPYDELSPKSPNFIYCITKTLGET